MNPKLKVKFPSKWRWYSIDKPRLLLFYNKYVSQTWRSLSGLLSWLLLFCKLLQCEGFDKQKHNVKVKSLPIIILKLNSLPHLQHTWKSLYDKVIIFNLRKLKQKKTLFPTDWKFWNYICSQTLISSFCPTDFTFKLLCLEEVTFR